MKQRRKYTEEDINALNELRMELVDEMVQQFGEYEFIENSKDIRFKDREWTLEKIGQTLILNKSTIGRYLKYPTNSSEQIGFDGFKITIAKIKILNQYSDKVDTKYKLALSKRENKILTLENQLNKANKKPLKWLYTNADRIFVLAAIVFIIISLLLNSYTVKAIFENIKIVTEKLKEGEQVKLSQEGIEINKPPQFLDKESQIKWILSKQSDEIAKTITKEAININTTRNQNLLPLRMQKEAVKTKFYNIIEKNKESLANTEFTIQNNISLSKAIECIWNDRKISNSIIDTSFIDILLSQKLNEVEIENFINTEWERNQIEMYDSLMFYTSTIEIFNGKCEN